VARRPDDGGESGRRDELVTFMVRSAKLLIPPRLRGGWRAQASRVGWNVTHGMTPPDCSLSLAATLPLRGRDKACVIAPVLCDAGAS
jgi:hypothetical protein